MPFPLRLTATLLTALIAIAWPRTAPAQINTDQMLRVGQNALYFKDYMVAIQYFNRVIEAKPYLAQPYFMRSIAKLNLEDLDGAITDATTAIELNPFITDAYEVRGVALQNAGRCEEAVADYDRALEQLPDNRSILYNRAMALMQQKQYDRAQASFERLIAAHPRHAEGYVARARLNVIRGDTIAALPDLDKALELDRRSINAYILRSELNMARDSVTLALADADEALRLEPKAAGLYVNRAIMRHRADDYFGAMADLDYALELEPANTTALFNRALLRAEVHDTNRAITDLSNAIALRGADYRSLYNRAILYKEIADYPAALADINAVIAEFPDFAAAYFLRFDILREKGDMRAAERDYKRSLALAKSKVDIMPLAQTGDADAPTPELSQEEVARRFTSLLAVTDNARPAEQFNNENIRGRVQERPVSAEVEPMMTISYYTSTSELKPRTDFLPQVDRINKMKALSHLLLVTNRVPVMDDETLVKQHFSSVKAYDAYIATHTPRAIDYFGRAMDHVTLRDYAAAITDLDSAIDLLPDFAVGYLLRSYARAMAVRPAERNRTTLLGAIADLTRLIEMEPAMAVAFYNRACLLLEIDDLTGALSDLNRAIALNPDFGEAYYNRGYTYMKLGNRSAGVADLSRAGQLGIAPSYSLLKHINMQ